MIIQSPKGTVTQLNNFEVEETIDDKLPTAVALVLDHSGSMGTERINALQYGASKLIKTKNLPLRFHCPNGLHVRFITPAVAKLLYENHFQICDHHGCLEDESHDKGEKCKNCR